MRSLQIIIFIIVVSTTLFSSCSTTRYVPDGEYLLDRYEIVPDKRKVKKEELDNYVRQKPNKKILGFKFHLFLYNLSNKEKDKGINRWLRSIGEEPVIYDEFAKDKTSGQIELFLRNKGYYNSSVEDTTIKKKKKARTFYFITLNEPYIIKSISYEFEDTALASIIMPDTINSLIKRGHLFDVDVVSSERERIESVLKNIGYYNFSKEFIYFNADSLAGTNMVDLTLVVKKFREKINENADYFREIPHPVYKIGNVFINTDYNPREVLSNSTEYFASLDTLIIDGIHVVYSETPNIKPTLVIASTLITPGQIFNLNNVNQSYRHLSSLQLFRLITINFNETGERGPDGFRLLDCTVDLTPQTLQSFSAELEGTNSSGNIGTAGSLIYQHRNLFNGAENFDLRLKGAIETLKETRDYNVGNLLELGVETGIRFPKFILPYRTDQFIRKFSPSTRVSMAYNYQRRPDYVRTVASATLSYLWRGNRHLTHMVSPIELNLVKIPYKSQQFIDWLEGKYIFYSYQPHLISVSSYSLIFSNQNIQKNRDFVYVRLNTELAGNILWSFYRVANIEEQNGSYALFNTNFAQFARGDIDLRYYNIIDENNSMVYRFFSGIGLPYSNSTALPFEKKYFSGGANSIRAWQVRNLGPGSYIDPDPGYYPNQTGDIKLEANLEYRFKLFWLLEGALFVDAGNIWAITQNDERQGALFEFDKFYKDIAIGSGIGARFDFSYFVFRLDLGIKTRDPSAIEGKKWILGARKLTSDDLTLNLGIGYPF